MLYAPLFLLRLWHARPKKPLILVEDVADVFNSSYSSKSKPEHISQTSWIGSKVTLHDKNTHQETLNQD